MKKLMIDDDTYEMLYNYTKRLAEILKHGITFNQAIKQALENLEELTNGDK